MTANAKQVQLIHVGKSKLGWDDDHYKSVLDARYMAKSSKDLSYEEAENLLEYMRSVGFKPKRKRGKPKSKGIIYLPSEAQMSLIDVLQANVNWYAGEEGYSLWLKKRMRINKVATAAQASAVIEGLKHMLGITSKVIADLDLPFPVDLNNVRPAADGEPCVWVYDSKTRKIVKLPREQVYGQI